MEKLFLIRGTPEETSIYDYTPRKDMKFLPREKQKGSSSFRKAHTRSPHSFQTETTFQISMAAQEQPDKPYLQGQQKSGDHHHHHHQGHMQKLMSSYLGLSFTVFLGLSSKNLIPLLSSLQSKNKALTCKLMQAEEQLKQLHSRRREDSKANARVAEIFATHRHAWQQEEKRLLQQIDEGKQEISYLKGTVEEFERMKASVEDLKREIGERDEMMNFMNKGSCEMKKSRNGECYGDMGLRFGNVTVGGSQGGEECFVGGVVDGCGQSERGFSSGFLSSAASRFWSTKASSWQDMQHESHESVYHSKHFVARESVWKDEGVSTGFSSKLKVLEQQLMDLERFGKADRQSMQLHKLAKRYHSLAGKIDNLCERMKASDQHEGALSSEFQTQRHTEFLLEAFHLQQHTAEINDELVVLQAEGRKRCQQDEVEGQVKVAAKLSLVSLGKNFKEIQRGLEIWLARIIGDLEGTLAREGASRVREYYMSKYPFVQS